MRRLVAHIRIVLAVWLLPGETVEDLLELVERDEAVS